jgi:hypothetical protein
MGRNLSTSFNHQVSWEPTPFSPQQLTCDFFDRGHSERLDFADEDAWFQPLGDSGFQGMSWKAKLLDQKQRQNTSKSSKSIRIHNHL